jgi:hypothetical protein
VLTFVVQRRWQQGKELVEAESNKLENYLLQKFTKASGASNYAKMKARTRYKHATRALHTARDVWLTVMSWWWWLQECADILYQFNGGSSCVKRYISLLKMFFDTESLEMDEALADQGTYTARVQNLDNVELASARITEFYDDIIASCQKEYKV